MEERLKLFLEKQGVLKEFIKNLNVEYVKYGFEKITIAEHLDDPKDPEGLMAISGAFRFDEYPKTPWAKIHSLWLKEVDA